MVPENKSALVFDVDALIKGLTDKELRAIQKGTSPHGRKITFIEGDKPVDRKIKGWTTTTLNKFSIIRHTQYLEPNRIRRMDTQKFDFWSCDETAEDDLFSGARKLRNRIVNIE